MRTPLCLQMDALRRGVDVVVGTPGRVMDLLDRKRLIPDKVSVWALGASGGSGMDVALRTPCDWMVLALQLFVCVFLVCLCVSTSGLDVCV